MSEKTPAAVEETVVKAPRNKGLDWLLDIVKGFIVGTANVIPGVSGGTFMLVLGIYEKVIGSISKIFKQFKKSVITLLPILVGVAVAILSMSRLITYCLDTYTFATIMLFVGAVLGGMPMLIKKVRGEPVKPLYVVICLITFALVIGMLFLGQGHNADLAHMNPLKFLVVVFMGAIGSATMVIPGVSGSALLMTFGYYKPIYGSIGDITNSASTQRGNDIVIAIAFVIGTAIGIWAVAKLIDMLLQKFEIQSYWGIIGFILSSAIIIVLQNFFMVDGIWTSAATVLAGTSVLEYILGAVLAALGFYGAYKL
ncbi:MAG: DUF368 domain-containing protein [Clostridia bacterium]|nr:DUF368 domain-containing protein [Clostridia bacterium]